MGNYLSSSSSRSTSYQALREQVKSLGDKYPFGDDEILRVARCLAYLRYTQKHNNTALPTKSSLSSTPPSKEIPHFKLEKKSFLNDWAVHCSTLPPPNFDPAAPQPFINLLRVDPNLIVLNEDQNYNDNVFAKRMKLQQLVRFVEEEILPACFGQILEETLFALLTPPELPPPQLSTQNCPPPNKGQVSMTQDYFAIQRLHFFLNGLADASRRGSRKAITVIYNACAAIEKRQKVIDGSNDAGVGNDTFSETVPSNQEQVVSATTLIDLSYRLSLASLVMGMMMKVDENVRASSVTNTTDGNEIETDIETDNEIETLSTNDNDTVTEHETETAVIDIHEIEKMQINACAKNNNVVDGFDLSPFRPKQIDKSLVQSLVDFASNYSSSLSNAGAYSHTTAFSYIDNSSSGHGSSGGIKNNSSSDKQQNKENGMVSLEAFTAWAEANAQCLSSSIETFMHYIFFPDKPYPPSRTEFVFPSLRGQHSAFFKTKTSPLLFTFAAMSPSLSGAWFRLYTSDEDGLSFNRLQNSLLGYSGPTLLIIRETESGGIFGAFTSTAWKEAKDFYGNSDCFLFQVEPNVKVIRPRGRGGNNFMYCNPESRSKGYDGQAHGIGFGGTIEKPRLFIAESFDGCMASGSDLTFEAGALLPPPRENGDSSKTMAFSTNRKYFDIESLEVWGVGGDDLVKQALGARSQQREIAAANIRKARKVDKAAFLDDFKSGLIESKAFKHRGEIQGRGDCDCPIDDSEQKNYVYEK